MKKGFTLVELLAVIALIGILITISIPAYNNIKKKSAERTLENKISMLEVAAYNYGNDNINAVKSNPEDYDNITIANLIEAGYLTSESDNGNFLINPVTGLSMNDTLTISYEDYRIKVIVNGGTAGLNLTVLTDGGSWDGTTPIKLASGATTTINEPTKNHYIFTGWTVVGEGSSISDTTFTMGTKSTVITANWQAIYSCTLAATVASYTCSSGDLSGTKCNVGAATPSLAFYSTWDSGWICNASTETECWSSCYGVTITCSGNPTKTVDRAIDVSIDNGHECHCILAGSCTVTWLCSTGTAVGNLCYIDATPSSYYCPNGGELSGNNCYLYDQTSCPSGWTSS